MIADNQSLGGVLYYDKTVKVSEKDYKEVLSILDNTDYTRKEVSIKRDEICVHYRRGRVLLRHKFPVSFLSLGEVLRGDGTGSQSVEFSKDETKNREIKSKLLAIIK